MSDRDIITKGQACEAVRRSAWVGDTGPVVHAREMAVDAIMHIQSPPAMGEEELVRELGDLLAMDEREPALVARAALAVVKAAGWRKP